MQPSASTEGPSAPEYGIAPPGHRLPAETRLGRVRLQVADLDRSVAYYEQVIGLRVLHRADSVAALGAQADADGRADESPVLVELHAKPGSRPVPRRGLLGLYHFAILLPDRTALGRFLAHLDRIGTHAGMSDHLVSEAVYLTDPDGLGIEVYADRPRASWRQEGGQLAMTTIPLDVNAVVAAGGTTPWTGAPAGTVIGHVHLHVGDLARAEAFYHRALGFDKMVWGYPGALFLGAGGYHHHLGTNTWAAGAAPATDDDARLLEWTIELPDLASVRRAAESLTLAGHTTAREEPAGDVIARDAWGTHVRIRSRADRAG